MNGPGAAVLGALMLAAFALAGGGIWLLTKRRDRTRAILMLVAAAVFAGNVLIWAV